MEKRQMIAEKRRETTDAPCLILLIVFSIIMLLLGVFCYFKGDMSKFNIPFDADGRGCGLDYPDYKYIYFPTPQYDSLSVTVCVKKCPAQGDKTIECMTNSVVVSCLENNSADNSKAFHIYPTQQSRGSICLPTSPTIKQKILLAIAANTMSQVFGSVIRNWSLYLLTASIAVGMSLLAILLIRLMAGYVIYILYFLSIGAFVGFAIYLMIPADSQDQTTFILKKNQPISIICSLLSFLMAFIILLLFCSYKQKIKIATTYIDQANQFFKHNYSILFLPLILIGILILFLLFCLFLLLSFYSMSSKVEQIRTLPFQHFHLSPEIAALFVLNMFYLLWGCFFLIHTGNFIMSSTLINWQLKKKDPYSNASKAYLFSHIGSVCIGSFLTALLGLFKFELDQAQCGERNEAQQQKCSNYIKKCYGCLCCCCINFLFKCFHHASYAYMNLSGVAYCQSSLEVVQILKEQKQKWSIIAFLYMIFDQFIPIAFSILSVLISNALINNIQFYYNNTSNRWLVFVVVGLITYSISQFFISIYAETIQSIFVLIQFHKRFNNEEEFHISGLDQLSRKPMTPRSNKGSKPN